MLPTHTPLLTRGDSCHATLIPVPLSAVYLLSLAKGRGGSTSSNEGGKYRKQKQTSQCNSNLLVSEWNTRQEYTTGLSFYTYTCITARTFSDASER
jgi:hypothetical protein